MKKLFLLLNVLVGSSFCLRAVPPDWSMTTGHQNAMVVYATVVDSSGNPMTNPGSLLSAWEYGVLTGVTPPSIGPKTTVYQLKVGSDRWESELKYRFYDSNAGRIVEIGSGPDYVAGSIVGTIIAPVVLKEKQ
jgi:hypothetical protein